ncbi:MAG: hypothetical protein KJO36_02150, partial [Acidimicrobiia bacterium]|nr:hypothetical protein [Acidimicrobiia bacterium]
ADSQATRILARAKARANEILKKAESTLADAEERHRDTQNAVDRMRTKLREPQEPPKGRSRGK